jgi:hypothetical protein
MGETDATTFDKIHKTTWGSAEKVTSTFYGVQLLPIDVGSSIDYSRTNP